MESDRERLQQLIALITEKRGEHTVVLDMREFSLGVDYFVITEGGSVKQLRAIAERIIEGSPEQLFQQEGQESGDWIVLDYGEIMIHIFAPATRCFYDLEGLWGDTVVQL
ncbi:MAG TPA: ribosome silencing factor [Candidatus Fraserbacteria bacterium]|nr:ribosome silencing factor [Candidatus Fraserbacteria bacterium]